jgi:hypothetical protein
MSALPLKCIGPDVDVDRATVVLEEVHTRGLVLNFLFVGDEGARIRSPGRTAWRAQAPAGARRYRRCQRRTIDAPPGFGRASDGTIIPHSIAVQEVVKAGMKKPRTSRHAEASSCALFSALGAATLWRCWLSACRRAFSRSLGIPPYRCVLGCDQSHTMGSLNKGNQRVRIVIFSRASMELGIEAAVES